jgi:hypothetical protein
MLIDTRSKNKTHLVFTKLISFHVVYSRASEDAWRIGIQNCFFGYYTFSLVSNLISYNVNVNVNLTFYQGCWFSGWKKQGYDTTFCLFVI